jgi:hypothetical protein
MLSARQASRRTLRGGRGPRGRWLLAAALVAALGAPVGWTVADRLEQDNDFCNACHLEGGDAHDERGSIARMPLHIEIRRDFDRHPPRSLAGVHGGARVEARPDSPAFRCVDCHGGTSFAGRARVKALAAKDALLYVVGRFEEPTGMRWPLWDEDCRKCHARFRPPADPYGTPPFHAVTVHNARMPVACVDCHGVHERGGNPDAWFLHAGSVRRQCARCHAEYED